MNQPMWPSTPSGPPSTTVPASLDVRLVLVDVLPVLEHGVDLAVGHRLEDRDLGDLRDLDRAAELVLEHDLRDVDVRRRAGPRVLVDRDVAALLPPRRSPPRGRRRRSSSFSSLQRGDARRERQHEQRGDPERSSRALSFLCRPLHRRTHEPRAHRAARRLPWVTRSSAIPSARIASDATTPCPNSLRWSPRATMSPSAPEPTRPPITTTASTMMIPWLTPSMIASRASGTLTFASTCLRVAPNADAASTAAGGDVAHAVRHEADHDRRRVEHRRDDARARDTGIR